MALGTKKFLEMYPDPLKTTEIRWRVWSQNGKNLGNGGESFTRRSKAIGNFCSSHDFDKKGPFATFLKTAPLGQKTPMPRRELDPCL